MVDGIMVTVATITLVASVFVSLTPSQVLDFADQN